MLNYLLEGYVPIYTMVISIIYQTLAQKLTIIKSVIIHDAIGLETI